MYLAIANKKSLLVCKMLVLWATVVKLELGLYSPTCGCWGKQTAANMD